MYTDSLLRPLPPSHRPFTSFFPNKHVFTPIKVSSFRTTSAGVVHFSGKLLLVPSLFLQGSHFPTTSSSFSIASPSLSVRRLVKAKRESEGGKSDAHFLKRHAGKMTVVLVGSLVLLFAGLSGKPVFWSDKAAKTTPLPASERRDEDEVVDGYLRVLKRNPRDVEALKMVLYGKMRSGRTKEAVEYVEKLIEVEADEVEWRLLQALCYELMGHLTKAKRLFNEILKEKPLLIKALHVSFYAFYLFDHMFLTNDSYNLGPKSISLSCEYIYIDRKDLYFIIN